MNETISLMSARPEPLESDRFEKDPTDLDVGIDIRSLRKVYKGETGW